MPALLEPLSCPYYTDATTELEGKRLYLIRFKEIDMEFTAVRELFFIPNRHEAEQVASELNDFIQNTLLECKSQDILGCVSIPQLDVFITSTRNDCLVEVIEIKRFEPLQDLTFIHLLA